MNWAQFKDPHCYLCLQGAVVASWFITQEVRCSNTSFLQRNSTNSVDSSEFIWEKLDCAFLIPKVSSNDVITCQK